MKATYNGPYGTRVLNKGDLPDGALDKKTSFPQGEEVEVPEGFKDAIEKLNENWSFSDGTDSEQQVLDLEETPQQGEQVTAPPTGRRSRASS